MRKILSSSLYILTGMGRKAIIKQNIAKQTGLGLGRQETSLTLIGIRTITSDQKNIAAAIVSTASN
jgi:hypothetical protein